MLASLDLLTTRFRAALAVLSSPSFSIGRFKVIWPLLPIYSEYVI
jgi:hypothetical protein